MGHTGPREVLVHLYERCSNPVHDVSGTLPYRNAITGMLPACATINADMLARIRPPRRPAAEAALMVYGGHLRPCAYSGSYIYRSYPRQLDRGVGYPEGLVVSNRSAYYHDLSPDSVVASSSKQAREASENAVIYRVGLRGHS